MNIVWRSVRKKCHMKKISDNWEQCFSVVETSQGSVFVSNKAGGLSRSSDGKMINFFTIVATAHWKAENGHNELSSRLLFTILSKAKGVFTLLNDIPEYYEQLLKATYFRIVNRLNHPAKINSLTEKNEDKNSCFASKTHFSWCHPFLT